tara:strand:+ start:332 stop:457 length:126 start_codon:yes stop_codon:yes gene_type:complete
MTKLKNFNDPKLKDLINYQRHWLEWQKVEFWDDPKLKLNQK